MTPAARIQAAIELLSEIEAKSGTPPDRIAAGYLRSRRYIGSKDRRAVSDTVFAVLRAQARLSWWLARAGAPETARTRVLAWLVLCGREQAPDGLFDGSRYGPSALSEPERALAAALAGQGLDHGEQPPWVRGEWPAWLYPVLGESLGPELERELAALAGPATLDLRVNLLKADRETARRSLAEEGIEAEATPLSPWGLRVRGRHVLPATRAFRGGLIEVQDEASQLAALLTGARPGMAVADLCAGAGGKTLALAAAMENRGRLVALDRDGRRLARAGPRLARAGATCAELWPLAGAEDPWLADAAGQFDRVLVDAPCSGSGTWRRDPAARWRLSASDLERMIETQDALLAQAAPLVAPGGRLIYVTCSLLDCENRDRVQTFLESHSDFAQLPIGEVWADVLGGACPAPGPDLRLTPGRHGTDGFYVAVLERGGSAV